MPPHHRLDQAEGQAVDKAGVEELVQRLKHVRHRARIGYLGDAGGALVDQEDDLEDVVCQSSDADQLEGASEAPAVLLLWRWAGDRGPQQDSVEAEGGEGEQAQET